MVPTQEVEQYITRRREAIEQIRMLLIEHLSLPLAPDQIDPDAAFFGSGLGLDSVDAMEVVVLVETQFGITLSDPEPDPVPQDGALAAQAPSGAATLQLSLRTLNCLVDSVLWWQDQQAQQAKEASA